MRPRSLLPVLLRAPAMVGHEPQEPVVREHYAFQAERNRPAPHPREEEHRHEEDRRPR